MSIGQPLDNPFRHPDPTVVSKRLESVAKLFDCYRNSTTAPLPSSNLVVTPEIRYQSELYLPVNKLRHCFYALFRQALLHTPVYSSTPFHNALSWADLYCSLPHWAQLSPNPARYIEHLLSVPSLLEKFVYFSFLPERFNGSGFDRYKEQYQYIFKLLKQWETPKELRMLDAACGSGEGSWELLSLADKAGLAPDQLALEGWTLDPLEVFSARHQYLPHIPQRESAYRQFVKPLYQRQWDRSVVFRVSDLLALDAESARTDTDGMFDIIVCNGLLGGPVINQPEQVTKVINTLASRLTHGGVLLIDNCFHGGWKKRFTADNLKNRLSQAGLETRLIESCISATRIK